MKFAEEHDWTCDTVHPEYDNYCLHHVSIHFSTEDNTGKWAFATKPTVQNANIAALSEAVERYSCTKHIPDKKIRLCRTDDIRLVSLDEIIPLSPSQKNRLGLKDEKEVDFISCVEGIRPLTGEIALIPTDLITYWDHKNVSFRHSNSNGVAAHTSYNKARQRALYELVERHSFLLHWYTHTPCRQIVPKDENAYRLQKLHDLGKEAYLLDISTDELPIAACIIFQDKAPFCSIGLGNGTTFHIAAAKAISEAIDINIDWSKNWTKVNSETLLRLGNDCLYPQWGTDHLWWYARSAKKTNTIRFLIGNHSSNVRCIESKSFEELISKYDPVFYEYEQVVEQIHVVRALSSHCIPLLFGTPGEASAHPLLVNCKNLIPHPLS